MFEQAIVPEQRRPPSFWLKIGVGVLLVFVGINAYRVNQTEPQQPIAAPVIEDTKGTLIKERIIVDALTFASYRMSFPRRSTLTGTFRVYGKGPRILYLLVNEENFELWKLGLEYRFVASTGTVPSGRMVHVLQPGTYFLVFDNGKAVDRPVTIDADFTVD